MFHQVPTPNSLKKKKMIFYTINSVKSKHLVNSINYYNLNKLTFPSIIVIINNHLLKYERMDIII